MKMPLPTILLPALLLLAGCATAPATSAPPPLAVPWATVLRAIQVLRPYEDPQHTYTMGFCQISGERLALRR